MKVDIYITTVWKGNFADGVGAYGILLEAVWNGEPVTREHYAGWSGTSYQKLNVRAAAEALSYMAVPSDVVIHTDNAYLEYANRMGETKGKHSGLWLQYFAGRNRMHSVRVVREHGHRYSDYLKRELAKGKYAIVEDRKGG